MTPRAHGTQLKLGVNETVTRAGESAAGCQERAFRQVPLLIAPINKSMLLSKLSGSISRSRVDPMKTLEVKLPEPTASRLEDAAHRLRVSPEDLLRLSLEEKLSRLDDSFRDAVEHVVSKNAELYKRLS